jgi:arginine exporter protein ArgO
MIVFGLVQLALLATFVGEAIWGDKSRILTNLVPTAFTMGMMAFPIWYGFRLWKSAIATVPANPSITPTRLSAPRDNNIARY